ncbi:MAG: AAA domain-containing protein [Candidatus Gribaldobacteria bacterium]|nr:AAA domain-containing protein [Candidatus Gribaldobacteria bacterium]
MSVIKKATASSDLTLDKKLKNLRYYQNKAIDFSKRNRLLKYPNRATSIEFDIPLGECQQFFGSIAELKIELPHKDILKQDDDQGGLFKEEKEELEFILPPTNITGKKLITQLDKLRLQAKNNFDSHGLHTLFIAIGEIKWKEELTGRGSSEAVSEWDYSAPLLLIPVEIINHKSPHKESVIQLNDELYDIQINPVLNLFIKQQLELKIPANLPESFDKFSWEEVQLILNQYQKIFKEDKGLDCIATNKIRIGQYTFHGQQIYEDLTRNEKAIIDHEFISSLCGDSQITQSSEVIQADDENDNIDDFLTEEEDFTILDADESQLRAIKNVIDGKHMVIHGPPGTGKSQTIANLIANLLARGKKVLFVCEKQEALRVVYNRLKTRGADVSDLCLPLFEYTADKKFFAKLIIESRDKIIRALKSNQRSSVNQKLAERKERMDILENYAQALLTVVEPLNREVYWIHGELARVAPKVKEAVLPWREKNHNEIDYALYQKIITIFSELVTYSDVIFDSHNHWTNLRQQTFSPDYSARLSAKLEEFKKVVVSFPKLEGTIFGKPQNIIEIEKTLNLADALNIEEVLENRLIVTEKINAKNLKLELDKLETIKAIVSKYQETSGESGKFKTPSGWQQIKLDYELLDKSFDNKTLVANKNNLFILKTKTETLRSTIKKNKHSKELLGFSCEALKRYKDLFYTDPIVQKIKGWGERINLYEVQNNLKQIKVVYDRLLGTQETLNEWAVSLDNLDKDSLWELEQRFATKYKIFFRIFYSTYKKDISLVINWCAAHRPQNFREYRQIVSAAADKIRLQGKFEKMTNEFIQKYGSDDSMRNISTDSLIDSVSKILNYLEVANIDKLNNEIKNLFVSTECFDSFKHIISLLEELLEQKQLLNTIIGQELLTENTSIDDLLKYVAKITSEAEKVTLVYENTSDFISQNQLPSTIAELKSDVESLNNLKSFSDDLVAENFDKHTNFVNIEDLTNRSNANAIKLQQEQIRSVLPIVAEHSFSKISFYENIAIFHSNIGVWENWHEKYQRIKEELQHLMNNDEALIDLELVKISDFSDYINGMITDTDGLEKWMKYQRSRGQLEEYGMLWFVDDIKKYQINKVDFPDIFVWSFLNKVLDDVHQKNEVLKNFNMADYNRCISEFKRLEREVFEANQYRVLDRVYPQIRYAMNCGGNSERVIVRESQKIKRHLPIRKLVMENATHVLDYKPCWMMSPLTLSSYIPFGSMKFDVVIFDEASQMKIENALGAIARAKQVVVIGDEHQLPPTSFFDVSLDEDEEDETEEVGYESILQSAITILPGAGTYLTYHYRSRHPDLIAFSNHNIYDYLLTLFPVPKDYEAVKFEFVENGVYDAGQTRTNLIEANRVAELCVNHFESNSTSLGVIAFSKVQEEAIRDEISKKISLGEKYSYLADKFDEATDMRNKVNEESSFFIKNLESVQGDQRDVIILSIGYGPDKNDNVFNRFGPINSKGGYRRLNVAITRARDKIICVSSMKSCRISPSETRGVILLQKYLEYAEKGRSVLEASKIAQQNNKEPDSDFEVSVQKELQRVGYTIHQQVGAAGFYIDLAVVDPDNQNEYVLGIECDGAAYHSSKSARIRDRLRQEILERLGWKIYRVWSQHWIMHRQEILDDIVKCINKM